MQLKAEGRVAQKVAAEVRVLQSACLCCRQGRQVLRQAGPLRRVCWRAPVLAEWFKRLAGTCHVCAIAVWAGVAGPAKHSLCCPPSPACACVHGQHTSMSRPSSRTVRGAFGRRSRLPLWFP